MKKILAVLLSAVVVFGLAACGSSEAETTGASSTGASSKYVFTAKGTTIAMNAPAADIIAALGEPTSYFESESCAFKGLDKQYTYGSFIIYTYPKDDVDYINEVDIADDSVTTPEGIAIGATLDQVKAAYGEPTGTVGSAGYQYVDGDCTLLFVFDEETGTTLQSISYTADTGLK